MVQKKERICFETYSSLNLSTTESMLKLNVLQLELPVYPLELTLNESDWAVLIEQLGAPFVMVTLAAVPLLID